MQTDFLVINFAFFLLILECVQVYLYCDWLCEVEKWWEDYAYLVNRMPHAPFVNFSGPSPYSRIAWPPLKGTHLERGSHLERAALAIWYTLQFWDILRKYVESTWFKITTWSWYAAVFGKISDPEIHLSSVVLSSIQVIVLFFREKLGIHRGGKTTVWSMSQFRRMFNACKTPAETIDILNHYFKTGCGYLLLFFATFKYILLCVLL